MKDSLYLAAMLRRFTREKEEMKKRNPNMVLLGLAGGEAHKPRPANNSATNNSSSSSSACNSSAHLQGGAGVVAGGDLLLADLASDPAVMSLLGSANEKELQDLLGDLDFGLLDGEQQQQQQHGMAAARENGVLGVGAPPLKGAVGGAGGGGSGGQGRGPGTSSGLFSPPPLPDRLPAPLIKRIEDLRSVSRDTFR